LYQGTTSVGSHMMENVRTTLSKLSPAGRLRVAQDYRPTSVNLIWETSRFEKTPVFWISESPQNRHPERSASQMDRVPQRLVARSRRTPTLLICPCCSELFNHRSPSPYLRFEFEDFQDIWTAITRKNNAKAGGAKRSSGPSLRDATCKWVLAHPLYALSATG